MLSCCTLFFAETLIYSKDWDKQILYIFFLLLLLFFINIFFFHQGCINCDIKDLECYKIFIYIFFKCCSFEHSTQRILKKITLKNEMKHNICEQHSCQFSTCAVVFSLVFGVGVSPSLQSFVSVVFPPKRRREPSVLKHAIKHSSTDTTSN